MDSLEFASKAIARSPLIQLVDWSNMSEVPCSRKQQQKLGIELDTSQPAIQTLYPMGYCCHTRSRTHTHTTHTHIHTSLQTKAILRNFRHMLSVGLWIVTHHTCHITSHYIIHTDSSSWELTIQSTLNYQNAIYSPPSPAGELYRSYQCYSVN